MDSNGLFVFLPKENPNMEKAFFNWPVVLHFGVKAKHRLILKSSSGMTFFHPSVNQLKAKRACIRSTNQSNRSISIRSFVVSVLFACFHFKVIRKSL